MLRYSWLIVFDGTLSAKVNTISLLRAGCRHTRYGEFALEDANMNRLTKSKPLWEYEAMNLSLTDLHMRLKAYEDIGLEPEEMRELLHDSTGPLHKKLGEWIDAGQDGRLLVLPCKVGDTIYAPTRNFISEFRVSQFDFGGYKKPYLWVEWYLIKGITGTFRIDGIGASEIGKTVFLSREDAEKALEEMKNDK